MQKIKNKIKIDKLYHNGINIVNESRLHLLFFLPTEFGKIGWLFLNSDS